MMHPHFCTFLNPPLSPPTNLLDNQPTYSCTLDSLFKRRTHIHTQKYQLAFSFSLYGTPPPPHPFQT